MKGLMSEKQLLISSLIEHSAQFHGDKEIVEKSSDGKVSRITYKNIHLRMKKIAAWLLKNNTKLGDRIATLAWSNQRHLELYYSISGIGAVCHTINPRLFKEQLIYIINDAKDKIIFIDLDLLSIYQEISSQCTSVEKVVVMCHSDVIPKDLKMSESVFCYEEIMELYKPIAAWPKFDEKTASSLCYTSGTTGNPKGVLYSHRSTIIHTLAAANPDALNISNMDVVMPIAPMFHANAWGIPYVATMVGAKIVLPGKLLDGENIYNLIEHEEVSFTAAVPTVWLMLFEFLNKNQKILSKLKSCVIGGSACPKFMIEEFDKNHGVKVIHAWGMTETSPLGTVNRPLSKHHNLSKEERYNLGIKQGRPIYGVEIKITDDNNKTLPNNGKVFGNLWVRGPWICSGYLNIENSDSHEINSEWFQTGDVATIDLDGFMHITDRVKDVIKSGGEWISSIEIENIVMGHPNVIEAAVVGIHHKKWNERPLLLIVKKGKLEKKQVFEFLEDKIAKWWIPDDIVYVKSLPHTATGKVKKIELKEAYKNYVTEN